MTAFGDQPPRVAILVETARGYGRQLLRGVIHDVRLHGPWSIYIAPGDLEQVLPRMERWGGTGVLARVESARAARAIAAAGRTVAPRDRPRRAPGGGNGRFWQRWLSLSIVPQTARANARPIPPELPRGRGRRKTSPGASGLALEMASFSRHFVFFSHGFAFFMNDSVCSCHDWAGFSGDWACFSRDSACSGRDADFSRMFRLSSHDSSRFSHWSAFPLAPHWTVRKCRSEKPRKTAEAVENHPEQHR